MRRVGEVVLGATLLRVLALVGGDGPRGGATAMPRPSLEQPFAVDAPRSRRVLGAALACFAVGALLMLIFDTAVTRVAGVLLLASFVVLGVFAVADPRWLAGAEDDGGDA